MLNLIIFAASRVGSQLTSHLSLVRLPLLLRELLAGCSVPFFWLVCTWAGIMVVITTSLHKAIPRVGANACAALKHSRSWSDSNSFVLSLLWSVQQTSSVHPFYFIRSFFAIGCPTNFAARILKILACSWNLACAFKGCFIWYRRTHLMALGFQWTKYCSWDVGICQSPWALAFFWNLLLVPSSSSDACSAYKKET
jgi:hypothetical protein